MVEYVGLVIRRIDAAVQDSIAFNSEIKAYRAAARIGDGLSNNYANENMYVEVNGSEVEGESDLNSGWGADMSKNEFSSESFLTNPENWINEWNFEDVWEIKDGADRPTLQDVGNDDGRLYNSKK